MDIPRQRGSAHEDEESPVFFDSSGKFISRDECNPSLEDPPPSCDLTSSPVKGDERVTVCDGEESISSIVTSCDDSGVSCDESSRCVTPSMLVSDESSKSALSCEVSSRSITPRGTCCDTSSRSVTPLAVLPEDSARSITPVIVNEDTPTTEDCNMVLVFNDEGGAYEEVKGDAVICNKKKKTSKSATSPLIPQPDTSKSSPGKLPEKENKHPTTTSSEVGNTVPCSEETQPDTSGQLEKEGTNEGGKEGREVNPTNDEGTSNIPSAEKEANCEAASRADQKILDAEERAAADADVVETNEKAETNLVVTHDAAELAMGQVSETCGGEQVAPSEATTGSENQNKTSGVEKEVLSKVKGNRNSLIALCSLVEQINEASSKEEDEGTSQEEEYADKKASGDERQTVKDVAITPQTTKTETGDVGGLQESSKEESSASHNISSDQEGTTSSLAHSASQPEVTRSSPVAHEVSSSGVDLLASSVTHTIASSQSFN